MMTRPVSYAPGIADISFLEQSAEGTATVSESSAIAQGHALDDEVVEWSEEDIVLLHWKMLEKLADLGEPATPLAEKLDILRWVFAGAESDDRPFSFASCIRVVTQSPMSPIPYCGVTDVDQIRAWVSRQVRVWLAVTLERYPGWVRDAVLDDPERIEGVLARNPQWLNEQVKKHRVEGDLFA